MGQYETIIATLKTILEKTRQDSHPYWKNCEICWEFQATYRLGNCFIINIFLETESLFSLVYMYLFLAQVSFHDLSGSPRFAKVRPGSPRFAPKKCLPNEPGWTWVTLGLMYGCYSRVVSIGARTVYWIQARLNLGEPEQSRKKLMKSKVFLCLVFIAQVSFHDCSGSPRFARFAPIKSLPNEPGQTWVTLGTAKMYLGEPERTWAIMKKTNEE